MMRTTLVLLKPDAIARGLVGTILSRFEAAGLRIDDCRLCSPDEAQLESHYADLRIRNAPAFAVTIRSLANRPFIAVRLAGIDAVQKARARVGATDPRAAAPGTIRGDFGNDSLAQAAAEDRAVNNLVHASDSESAVVREVAIWFGGTSKTSPIEAHTP